MNLIRRGRRRWKCTSKRKGGEAGGDKRLFIPDERDGGPLFGNKAAKQANRMHRHTRTGTCAPRRSNLSHNLSHNHKKKEKVLRVCASGGKKETKPQWKKIANSLARRGSRLHTQQKAAAEQKNRMLRPNDESWQTTASPSSPCDSLCESGSMWNHHARICCQTAVWIVVQKITHLSPNQWSIVPLFAAMKWQQTRGCTYILLTVAEQRLVLERHVPKTAGCELVGSPEVAEAAVVHSRMGSNQQKKVGAWCFAKASRSLMKFHLTKVRRWTQTDLTSCWRWPLTPVASLETDCRTATSDPRQVELRQPQPSINSVTDESIN